MNQVILDCDPGHDDALAILLAARHLAVVGITTVSGNQPLDKVTTNALKVLEFSDLTHIPVIAGMDRPLVAAPRHAVSHGESGLDGPVLPEPTTQPHPGHAVEFIADTVMSSGEVALIATGPLTNVAAALRREPRLSRFLPQISLMGGSLTFGNSTAAAEFNLWCDPEAAHIVFNSGVPIKMVGLNLTHQAVATTVEIARFRALGNHTGEIVAQFLDFHRDQYRTMLGLDGAPLHDPCAVAWLVDPALIVGREMHVAVELHGAHTRGMTVCDYRHLLGTAADLAAVERLRQGDPPLRPGLSGLEPANVEVGLYLDQARFFDLLLDAFASYP